MSTSVCVAKVRSAHHFTRRDAPYGKTIPDDGGNDFRRLRDIDRANDELEEDDEGEATLFMEEWDAVSLSIPSHDSAAQYIKVFKGNQRSDAKLFSRPASIR